MSQPRLKRPTDPKAWRRWPGELTARELLNGVLEATRAFLEAERYGLQARQQGSLVQVFGDDPAVHFELWLHRNRARVELGLHFETRNATRNQRMLDHVADELPFLKAALGESLEAEPWEKGWTRLYLTRPLDRLGPQEQAQLSSMFREFISVLEPLRQEAVELH